VTRTALVKENMDLDKVVKKLGFNRIKINEPLSEHVYMKVGGPADLFYEAKTSAELAEAVKAAIEAQVPVTVLGNGANVLVSDKGVRGLVIKNSAKSAKFLSFGFVEAESGVDMTALIIGAKNRKLVGMERMLKVPATVGGAVYMNAGDTGKTRFFGDLVVSVEVIDKEGNEKKLRQDECEFAYRSSRFQKTGEVILKAKIQLQEGTKEQLEGETRDILVRKMNHPGGATIGSTFKNPLGEHAGEMIEKAGLKGTQIGGAKISEKHGNFILNTEGATADDVKALIELMKVKVYEQFGTTLEEEVRYIGEWD